MKPICCMTVKRIALCFKLVLFDSCQKPGVYCTNCSSLLYLLRIILRNLYLTRNTTEQKNIVFRTECNSIFVKQLLLTIFKCVKRLNLFKLLYLSLSIFIKCINDGNPHFWSIKKPCMPVFQYKVNTVITVTHHYRHMHF